MPLLSLKEQPLLSDDRRNSILDTDGNKIATARFVEKNVAVIVYKMNEQYKEHFGLIGTGTLKLYWYNDDVGRGWQLDYPTVILHAISRAGSSPQADRASVYLQLDADISEFSDSNEDEDDAIFEMKIIPSRDVVDDMFLAFSECSSLHPDEAGDDNELFM